MRSFAKNFKKKFQLLSGTSQVFFHQILQHTSALTKLLRQNLLGHRLWVARNKLIFDGIAKFVYKYLTTLKSLQTLGEEYTGIIQLDKTGRELPSKFVSCIVLT